MPVTLWGQKVKFHPPPRLNWLVGVSLFRRNILKARLCLEETFEKGIRFSDTHHPPPLPVGCSIIGTSFENVSLSLLFVFCFPVKKVISLQLTFLSCFMCHRIPWVAQMRLSLVVLFHSA